MPDKLRQQTSALIIANNPQQDWNRKILQRVRESLSEAGIGLVSERVIAGVAVRLADRRLHGTDPECCRERGSEAYQECVGR